MKKEMDYELFINGKKLNLNRAVSVKEWKALTRKGRLLKNVDNGEGKVVTRIDTGDLRKLKRTLRRTMRRPFDPFKPFALVCVSFMILFPSIGWYKTAQAYETQKHVSDSIATRYIERERAFIELRHAMREIAKTQKDPFAMGVDFGAYMEAWARDQPMKRK